MLARRLVFLGSLSASCATALVQMGLLSHCMALLRSPEAGWELRMASATALQFLCSFGDQEVCDR